MYYVYCLVSESSPAAATSVSPPNLRQRVSDHNRGCTPSTAEHRPSRLKGYVAFGTKTAALAFERYLKTGSGHAFRNKRLW